MRESMLQKRRGVKEGGGSWVPLPSFGGTYLLVENRCQNYIKKIDHTKYGLSMAAEEGFEPSQTESESVVLPLHNSAIY